MSLANVFEASIVWEGRNGAVAADRFDMFMEEVGIETVPVTAEHVAAARRTWRRFGKGNHPAALNFGDCFAYALAEVTGEPLLYKGEDFALTDMRPRRPGTYMFCSRWIKLEVSQRLPPRCWTWA